MKPLKTKLENSQVILSGRKNIYIILFSFTFLLYFNTLSNEYALDDSMVITQNNFVKKGMSGIADIFINNSTKGFTQQDNLLIGGRYRPFSIATFALEYEFFGSNPYISHFINLILYFFTALFLFKVLTMLFTESNSGDVIKDKYFNLFSIPFISTILFIAHPIHTEVVANIKGRDEIIALLGSLLALFYLLKYFDCQKYKYLLYAFWSFFIALLSKESAIIFVIIIPLIFYFFYNLKGKFLTAILPLLVAAISFIAIRNLVLGTFKTEVVAELMNNPFIETTQSQKYATIFYTLGLYLKLLIFPHPLTCDYYPYHISIIDFNSLKAIVPAILYMFIIIYAIATFRKKNVFAFSIILYLIPLLIVSNLIFPIGTFMNERFLFVSSVGFFIAFSYALIRKLPNLIKSPSNNKLIVYSILIITLSFYSFTTIKRNKVWKNDFELFSHDVKISKNSAFSNDALGRQYYFKARSTENLSLKSEYAQQAILYLTRAVQIHPKYYDALQALGNSYYEFYKNYDESYKYYYQLLKMWPGDSLALNNIIGILNTNKDFNYKLNKYISLDSLLVNNYLIKYNIGIIYGMYLNNHLKAEQYLKESIDINTNYFNSLSDLGVVYLRLNKFNDAIEILNRALRLAPNSVITLQNLALAYSKSGNMAKSEEIYKVLGTNK